MYEQQTETLIQPTETIVQAIVVRFFSQVFQVAVLEAQGVASNRQDNWPDMILVNGRFHKDPAAAVSWLREFIGGIAQTLHRLRSLGHKANQQVVIDLYCDLDLQRAERVAVGAAIYQVLESMNDLDVPVLDVLESWFQLDKRTDSDIAWLMDTTAHMFVADSLPTIFSRAAG